MEGVSTSSHMVFKAPRTDEDVMKNMRSEAEYLDTDPPVLERVRAWNMRPRNKPQEIGPQFRFDNRTQLQRVKQSLCTQITNEFSLNECTSPMIEKKIKKFIQSGDYGHIQKTSKSKQKSDKILLFPNDKDDERMQKPLLFNPKQMLGGLHKKTHFKASETIRNGVGGSLRTNNYEITSQFHDIQKKMAQQKLAASQNTSHQMK